MRLAPYTLFALPESAGMPQRAALGRYIVLPFSASRSAFLGWLSVRPTLPSPGQPQAKRESSLSATACKQFFAYVCSAGMSESMGKWPPGFP